MQEKAYLDASNVAQKVLSAELSNFEELMIPADFKRKIPAEYDALPRLTGELLWILELQISSEGG